LVSNIPNYNCITSVCEITLTMSNGPGGPYTISSSPPGISGITSSNIFTMTNIPYQTSYNIFVATSGTCTGYGQALYSNPTISTNITVTNTNVTCFGGNNGAAVAGFPGTPPFTFQWSSGSTNTIVSGLIAGSYTVTISDSKGCVGSTPFAITQPNEINSQLSSTLIPCFGSSITTAVTTTGGVSPFTYTVNGNPINTAPGNIATNISVGIQSIVTKDNKGCIKTNTLLLNQAAQQIITANITQPNCPNESNGAISVSVSGPVAGYTYSWNPGPSSNTQLNNIPSGNYTLHVLDASNCITKSVIAVPPTSSINPSAFVRKEDCSAVDGAFTLNLSGGFPPYMINTLPTNNTGSVVSGLSTGSYTSIITDAHGCIDSAITFVGNLSTVSLQVLTVTPVKCYNTCDGSVILNVQNAVQPLTYSLTGLPVTSNSLISNLCAGFYIVKAVDNIGCPAFDTIHFPTPPAFSYSAANPPAICIGKQAKLSATALGGSGSLSYIWNPGALTGATVNVEPVITTTYNLNVYDSKGCTLPPYKVTVNVQPNISIHISNSNTGICPGTTAQITPTVTGGDGNYTYLWLPGGYQGSSIFVENITIPTYTLEVNDACGSPKKVLEIQIKIHPVIQPIFSQEGKGGCAPYCTKFINLTPASKNAIWNYGDKPFEKLGDTTYYCYEKAGNYNLRLSVTDSNQCKASFNYTNAVKVLEQPSARFYTEPGIITLNDAENVLLKNVSDNAVTFKWFADGYPLGSNKNLYYTFRDTGCYDFKLYAENINTCKDSTTISVCVFEGFNFYMPNAFTPNNDGLNDIFLPKGTGWQNESYKFEVFNRWGQTLFSTNNPNEGWNGGIEINTYVPDITKAKPNNVYTWKVSLKDNLGKDHLLEGFVTLVR
jgi:gliding motility-associated-like protein